jgi:hypothetical protein
LWVILIRMDELRIPKVPVAIHCHSTGGESFSGQVFLDMTSSAGFTTSQILEFFNTPQPFFPLKLESGQSILIQKWILFRIDVPELFHEYESEVFSLVDSRQEAVLHFAGYSLRGSIIVDMPKEHARVLDVVNSGRSFLPFLLETTLSLINVHHLHRIEEI